MRENQTKRAQVLSNAEIVTLAVYSRGGKTKSIDTEDVAVEANSLAPGRFSWRKYTNQINLDAVRKRLWDANKILNYVSGSESEGWMLTPAGLTFATARAPSASRMDLSGTSRNQQEKRWLRREHARMLASPAFAKYLDGRLGDVTREEFEGFFRIDDYITGYARKRKLDRLMNAFGSDAELGPAIVALAVLVQKDIQHGE